MSQHVINRDIIRDDAGSIKLLLPAGLNNGHIMNITSLRRAINRCHSDI